MSSDSFLKRHPLHIGSDIADILKRLNRLPGCIYLKNNDMPVIGLLPSAFLIHSGQHTRQYHRISDPHTRKFQYRQSVHTLSIPEFVQFAAPDDRTAANCRTIDFKGGYLGFFDYDFAAAQQIDNHHRMQPGFFLGRYSTFLKYENDQWILYADEQSFSQILQQVTELLLSEAAPSTPTPFKLHTACQPLWSRSQYSQAFEQVQDYIRAGDCYQVNLTQEFTATVEGTLLDTADQMWQLTQAPYAGYFAFDDFELLSCSPELFINFYSDRHIVTRPIKGTTPRYDNPILDEQSRQMLAHSAKDQAENVMIVDLLRNDLSVHAETGSVKTPGLFEIKSFNQVHHMVSEITATLKQDVHPVEMLMDALPGGSITGAPKIRAMQIIEELEAAPRGAYCGSMGFFNFDGSGSWNILIRTIQKQQDQLSLWAGSGITVASDCDAEYQECFDKVSAMLDLINTWH
ncbi:anthranilate synthase component I family protein [Acinetobacter sp. WZC-1]|uniref:anthranilate synthase component I family protein n=1 Tax=Acinetobacter sp. WZC-1 TaxID=3459034 RepID=UPI00403E310E